MCDVVALASPDEHERASGALRGGLEPPPPAVPPQFERPMGPLRSLVGVYLFGVVAAAVVVAVRIHTSEAV